MTQFLRDNYQRMEDKDVAAFLSRVTGQRVDTRAVERRRFRMGLVKYHLGQVTERAIRDMTKKEDEKPPGEIG
jgi:hypothetical protein